MTAKPPAALGLLLILLRELIDSRSMTTIIALCAATVVLALYGALTHRRIPHAVQIKRF